MKTPIIYLLLSVGALAQAPVAVLHSEARGLISYQDNNGYGRLVTSIM